MIRASHGLLAAILTATAAPAAAAERVQFDLTSGPLGKSAIELARAGGVSVGLTDLALSSRRTPAVRGELTVEQALARLLRGTGTRFVRVDARTYRIVRETRRPTPPATPTPPDPIETAAVEADIVVTALKRPVQLSDFPGAISAVVAGDPFLDTGGRGSEAIAARLHTVTSTHYGSGRNKLFVRGIADSSFNGPTQATVGQYLGETRINYNAPDPDLRLYDIERVEVLPGPQGTLYGAGSLGGIIRIIPHAPRTDRAEGMASFGLSATAHGRPGYDSAGMFNLPLIQDSLALRAVGYGILQGGYIDDALRGLEDINRTHIRGGRAALAGTFGEGWQMQLGGATQRVRSDDAQFADRDAPPLTRASPFAQPFRNDYDLLDLTLSRAWGGYRFVSATGVVHQRLRERYDSSSRLGPPRAFDQLTSVRMIASELRLSWYDTDGSGWLVGTSLVDNRATQRRALGDPARPDPIPGTRNQVTEVTAFGEATLRPREWLGLSGGGRIAWTDLSDQALDAAPFLLSALRMFAERNQVAFLPSASLTVRPADPLFGYVRYQQGFRPGGLAATPRAVQRFRGDRVKTLEAGVRYGLPGTGTVDAALALARTRWNDIQADIVDLAGFPTTANIGDGRVYSIDARLGWRPLPGLSIEAAGLFNDSLVSNPLPSIVIAPRSTLPNVARWNGRLSADYRASLGRDALIRIGASARYVGKSKLGIGAVLGETQGDWLDASLDARLELDRHAFTLGISNLLDQAGNRFALGSPFTLVEQPQVTPLVPRTIRVGYEIRF